MKRILESLKNKSCRESTNANYLSIWRNFNKFVIKLDVRPKLWEDRVSLFVAHLIDKGIQSATVRSYVSAIKKVLVTDGYQWSDSLIQLNALTKACKLINNRVKTRLPIKFNLLELLLYEVQRKWRGSQVYLETMYKAIFALTYYGLFCIGELCKTKYANHTIRTNNIHIGMNKEKIMVVLYTSKMHGKGSNPQKIKITSSSDDTHLKKSRNFCPFRLMRNYMFFRQGYDFQNEFFFIGKDRSPVTVEMVRNTLRSLLQTLGLDPNMYDTHSFHAGRASDMVQQYGCSVLEVKRAGRWRSNAVYHYLKF